MCCTFYFQAKSLLEIVQFLFFFVQDKMLGNRLYLYISEEKMPSSTSQVAIANDKKKKKMCSCVDTIVHMNKSMYKWLRWC